MTTYAPQTAPGRWIRAAELARESGLREDLIQRFMPADTTGPVPMYSAGAVPLAKYIKRLTDMGTPASAIDAAVRELHNNSGAMMQISLAAPEAPSRRGRLLAISGAAAAAALMIGGVIGGLINIGGRDAAPAAAPVTVTAEAPSADVRVPTTPDPVCAEWSPMNDSYQQKRQAWLKTDPNIAADQWSPEQRSLTTAVIPIMNAEAQDLIRLAGKAADPVLQYNLQMEAQYQKLFASRLPNYTPADQRLWQAANDFSNAVNSLCYAVAPR
ncbi:hypothetical protein [Mycobacterium avium]|uniref:hypothetical protein n=1 Tax=Mycobacterium avium TaxID=1764 RepID=UPI001CDA649C|nr:hypothetical protein [Mycobacterium avium]MCA2338430.1 hypothetical protein [Mycobacterium avium]